MRRDVYLAARIQASERYPNEAFTKGESLGAEQASWACNALTYVATSANPKYKSPYEMWYEKPPQRPLSLLKSEYRGVKQRNNLKPKTVKCWYLGPDSNRPRDAMRMLCKSCRPVATRNVTWAHLTTYLFSTSQQAVLAPNGLEGFQSGGGSGEAEEEPASRSGTESQSQSAEDNDESSGEEESEDASEGQPESGEDRESGGEGEDSAAESTSSEDDASSAGSG